MANGSLSRKEQKALRPFQILHAAFEEFVANGFTATRVEDIADRVGVTKRTIYVYFPTKEHLFSEMIAHISGPLVTLLAQTGALSGTCAERLKAFLLLAYEKVTEDRKSRELLRFVIAEGARFPHVIDAHHAELIEPLRAHTQHLLDEGVRTGEFRDAASAQADIVVAPILTLMMDMLIFDARRDMDVKAHIGAHLDMVFNGISATSSG